MGIPPDIEYGDDCLLCFPAGETPKYVYAAIAEMIPGAVWGPLFGGPPNGIWKLEQQPNPCTWKIVKPPFIWELKLQGPLAQFAGSWEVADIIFLSNSTGPCDEFFNNAVVFAGGHTFYKGKCKISFTG